MLDYVTDHVNSIADAVVLSISAACVLQVALAMRCGSWVRNVLGGRALISSAIIMSRSKTDDPRHHEGKRTATARSACDEGDAPTNRGADEAAMEALDRRQAYSKRVHSAGMRYTVRIRGRDKYLWYDPDTEALFVEAMALLAA